MRRNRGWVGIVATATASAWLGWGVALADPLNMDTGKTLSLQPGASGQLTLSLTNLNAGSTINNFNGWSTGLQLIPQVGAVGSATISSAALPATNPALTDPEVPLTLLPNQNLSVAANGTTLYSFLASANQSAAVTTFALGQSYNVADLTVTMSGNASGTWSLFAVNNANGIASWADQTGTATNFGNLAKTNGDAGTVLVGTVSAVPEPEGFVLAVSAMSVVVWSVIRSRRKMSPVLSA